MGASPTALGDHHGDWMLVKVEKGADPPAPWMRLGLLTVFWVGLGLFVGTVQFFGTRANPDAPTWIQTSAFPLLGGVLWIPLTLAILWVGRHRPPFILDPEFRIHFPNAVLQGIGSLGIGVLFNAVFFGILLAAGSIPAPEYTDLVTDTALGFVHLNAGVYWAIVFLAQMPRVLAVLAEARRRAEEPDVFEETLTVRSGTQSILVRVSDIRWIEGAGDYVRLHLGIANHLHSERLKRLEARLDPHRFVRVHRSAIVNVSAVRKLRHLGHGDYEAVLEGGSTVRVSRTRRSQLARVLDRREVGEVDPGQEG